jgi:hypothetical protein
VEVDITDEIDDLAAIDADLDPSTMDTSAEDGVQNEE